jgi:uncharacterized protein (DUF885 family)
MQKIVFVLISLSFFFACASKKPISKRLFYEKTMMHFGVQLPEMIGFVDPPLLDRFWHYKRKLNNVSPAFEKKMEEEIVSKNAILEGFNTQKMTQKQRLTYDILHYYLKQEADKNAFLYYDYPLNQLHGIQSETPGLMMSAHSVHGIRDVQSYLVKMGKMKEKFSQTLEGMEIRKQKGIIPPRFVLEKVLKQMQDFIATKPSENALYTSMLEKMQKAKIPSQRQQEYSAKIIQSLEKEVYPAYQALIHYCAKLLPLSTTDDGVWKFPNGKAYYAHILKTHTTSNLSAAEIHQMGLKEVERLEKEAKKILDSLGMKEKTVGEYLAILAKAPQFLYPETAEGRKQCLADYQALIDSVYKKIPQVFDIQPKSKVIVKPIPAFKEKTAPGAYYEPPSLGGKRPGTFFANLRSLQEIPTWSMATLVFHEAVPGHHFQIGIQQELKGVPSWKVGPCMQSN